MLQPCDHSLSLLLRMIDDPQRHDVHPRQLHCARGWHSQGWVSLGINFSEMPEDAMFFLRSSDFFSPSSWTWVGVVLGGAQIALL